MFLLKRKSKARGEAKPDMARMPRHVAFIMDGNGRWAQKRGLPRRVGHAAGTESLREMIRIGLEYGIDVMTFYAFSTENWTRPQEEVDGLMELIGSHILSEMETLHKNNVRMRFIGDLGQLSTEMQGSIAKAEEYTGKNLALVMNIALNYGGRLEIAQAAQALAREAMEGKRSVESIDEQALSSRLYTAGQPDPDLLVRTGGDFRLSNFLTYQTVYTEIYVDSCFWPDFRRAEFDRVLCFFQARDRRFGGIKL